MEAFLNFIFYFLNQFISDTLCFFFNVSTSLSIVIIEYHIYSGTNIPGEIQINSSLTLFHFISEFICIVFID